MGFVSVGSRALSLSKETSFPAGIESLTLLELTQCNTDEELGQNRVTNIQMNKYFKTFIPKGEKLRRERISCAPGVECVDK